MLTQSNSSGLQVGVNLGLPSTYRPSKCSLGEASDGRWRDECSRSFRVPHEGHRGCMIRGRMGVGDLDPSDPVDMLEADVLRCHSGRSLASMRHGCSRYLSRTKRISGCLRMLTAAAR